MSRGAMYAKMAGVFTLFAVGGPAIMYYITPAPGELFKRFSPELQQYNLDNRERRQREYEDFAGKMKEYSKSDKPIWEAARIAQEEARAKMVEDERRRKELERGVREDIKREIEQGR